MGADGGPLDTRTRRCPGWPARPGRAGPRTTRCCRPGWPAGSGPGQASRNSSTDPMTARTPGPGDQREDQDEERHPAHRESHRAMRGERGIARDTQVVDPERAQAGQEDLDRAEHQESQQQPAVPRLGCAPQAGLSRLSGLRVPVEEAIRFSSGNCGPVSPGPPVGVMTSRAPVTPAGDRHSDHLSLVRARVRRRRRPARSFGLALRVAAVRRAGRLMTSARRTSRPPRPG